MSCIAGYLFFYDYGMFGVDTYQSNGPSFSYILRKHLIVVMWFSLIINY